MSMTLEQFGIDRLNPSSGLNSSASSGQPPRRRLLHSPAWHLRELSGVLLPPTLTRARRVLEAVLARLSRSRKFASRPAPGSQPDAQEARDHLEVQQGAWGKSSWTG